MGKFQNPNAKKPMGRAKESVSQPPNALCNRARPIIASLRRLSCLPKPPFTCRQSEVRVKHNATFRTRRTPKFPKFPKARRPRESQSPPSWPTAACRCSPFLSSGPPLCAGRSGRSGSAPSGPSLTRKEKRTENRDRRGLLQTSAERPHGSLSRLPRPP